MSFETIGLEIEVGVGKIGLNGLDRLNSFAFRTYEALADSITQIEGSVQDRGLLVTGAGRGFCAGRDISDHAASSGAEEVDLGCSVESYYSPLIKRLATLDRPVTSAANGVAAGAGSNRAFNQTLAE